MDQVARKELLVQAQNGDVQCFTILFERLRPSLYAKALEILGRVPESADAVQETFLTAFARIHQLKDFDKFNTWIHTVLRSKCLLLIRDRKKEVLTDNMSFLKAQKSIPTCDILHLMEQRDLKDAVLRLIETLGEKKKAVIMLRFFSEFNSYSEIASMLAIPIGTVRSRLAQAKKQLCDTLIHGGDPEGLWNLRCCNEHREMFAELFPSFYRGERSKFLSSFDDNLTIRFSSGKNGRGLKRWAYEWDIDLVSGVRFRPNLVVCAGNLAIIEGPVINPPDKPNHCPPAASFVLFHNGGKVTRTHIHYAPRIST